MGFETAPRQKRLLDSCLIDKGKRNRFESRFRKFEPV